VINSKELLDRHFDKKLPHDMECKTCGATAKKVVGCCTLRYRWSPKKTQKDYDDVARFECSDCGDSYYAEIKGYGGRSWIGEKVAEPPEGITVRKQRMLCGGCQGKGGKGDQLNDLMKSQARIMDDLMGR
jgi:hypothetical protein